MKATTGDTEGRVWLLTVSVVIRRHVHHRENERIYVLDNELEIEFADRKHLATTGDLPLAPLRTVAIDSTVVRAHRHAAGGRVWGWSGSREARVR